MGKERHWRKALIRLNFIVEGQTEEGFIKRVVAPALEPLNIFASARIVQTSRKHGIKHKGGISSYGKLKTDILLWMKSDQSSDARFTTMIDFYGLPTDFPGYAESTKRQVPRDRAKFLECQMKSNIEDHLGNAYGDGRFVPFIQLHEFETILFCGPEKLTLSFPESAQAVANLAAIRRGFDGPEDINGGPDTHPSKRLLKALPGYDKRAHGIQTAEQIGLQAIRQACPHFNAWIGALERLAQ